MEKENTLLFMKMKDDSEVKDSFSDFGIVCTSIPFMPYGELKELPKRDWPGEDGEDIYIPDKIPLSAYDMEIGMCYKGDLSTCYDKIKSFVDYLTGKDGKGSNLKVYSPYTGIGRQNVYLKGISEFDFYRSNIDESLTFMLKLRVSDPSTDISLSKD